MTDNDADEIRERLPRFIRSGTDGPQPDAVYAPRLFAVMKRAGFDPAPIRKVLSELVEEGVIVEEQRDDEPHARYQLP